MAEAQPVRFWWLKRLSALILLLVVSLAALHWWMSRVVDRRLEAIVAAWRLDPEAPLPEMLLPEAGYNGIATGQDNAAFHYQQAMKLPALTQRQLDEWDNYIGAQSPMPPEKAPLVRQIVTTAAPQLAIAREARSLEKIDWNLPAIEITTSGNWNGVRALAIRLGWAMMLAHHDGNIAEAMRFGLDANRLAHAATFYGPSIIAGLVSNGVHGLAAGRFIDTAWHRPPGMTAQQEREAWRAAAPEVRAAINDLLDYEQIHQSMRISWKGERVLTLSVLDTPAGMTGLTLGNAGFMLPVYKSDLARLLELEDQIVEAVEARDPDPMFRLTDDRYITRIANPQTVAGRITFMLLATTAPNFERPNISFHRAAAQRHAAAVILAAKLYEAEQGRWPESLAELVPQYLPRVPEDPFAPAGTPIGYRTDTPVPIVYSISENLKDDGGSTAAPAGASDRQIKRLREEWASPWERRDLVFPLYLPPEYFQMPEDLNLWHYLENPQGEIQRARKARQERLEQEARDAQEPVT